MQSVGERNEINEMRVLRPRAVRPTRRALGFLFITFVLCCVWCAPRWNDWNQNSRLALVRAIVEYGTLHIDAYQTNTGDYAYYNGHYYSDKPPGPALAGVPFYAALRFVLEIPPVSHAIDNLSTSDTITRAFGAGSQSSEESPRAKLIGALARILLSIVLVAVPVAIMLCCFWLWVCEITQRYWMSLLLTLALAFGTPLFPYSSLLYNHALAAALLFIAFFVLYRAKGRTPQTWRLICVGALLGFSVISEYESILIAVPLAFYALATVEQRVWLRRLVLLAVGGLPFAALLMVYNYIGYGNPIALGYAYSTLWADKHAQGFVSITYPHLDALWAITFSHYRGLFFLSPFLLCALPGFYFGLRRGAYRAEALLCAWATGAFVLFNASSGMWWGGHAFGPRYLVTCLPFFVAGVAFLLRRIDAVRWRLPMTVYIALLATISVAIVAPATVAGREWPHETVVDPLVDYLWPTLLSGNIAPNPGLLIGLKGIISFVPLIGLLVLSYAVLFLRAQIAQQWRRLWRSDHGIPILLTSGLIFFTSLPYIFAYLRAPRDKVFMGIMLDVPDTTQYWAWMARFRTNFLIANPLTPEPNDPIFFNLLWFGLARLQTLTQLDPAGIYQAFRLLTILFFGTMAWRFCRFVFTDFLAQRTAFALILFGSGWGWLAIAAKQITGRLDNPLAVFVAEPNTFLSALAFPHLILSSALMLAIFYYVLVALERQHIGYALAAGGLALILGLEHTYDLIIVYAVLGAYWLLLLWLSRHFDRFHLLVLGTVGGLSALPALYSVYLTSTNSTWKGVLAQYGNAGVVTPDLFNLLILIGPLLFLAFIGLWAVPPIPPTVPPTHRLRFVKVWFVANAALLYIPTNFQIKMLNGWQIPVCMLAVAALYHPISGVLRRGVLRRVARIEALICALALLIALPTTIYYFSWRFVDLNRTSAPYYLSRDETQAIAWLHTKPLDSVVVLSSEDLGQYVAATGGQRPFLAHWAMTLDFYTKRRLAGEVLNSATTPDQRFAILRQYNVTYILYGAADKARTPELNDPYLSKVYSLPDADIYAIGQDQ